MSDTARTRAELVALLPDNTAKEITPQRLRDLLASVPVLENGKVASANLAVAKDYHFVFIGTVATGTDLTNHVLAIADSVITGAKAICKTAPSDTASWTIKQNGVSVGAITIAVGEYTGSATLTGSVTAGDIFSIDCTAANGAADATIILQTTI